jgi:hypothetical protein
MLCDPSLYLRSDKGASQGEAESSRVRSNPTLNKIVIHIFGCYICLVDSQFGVFCCKGYLCQKRGLINIQYRPKQQWHETLGNSPPPPIKENRKRDKIIKGKKNERYLENWSKNAKINAIWGKIKEIMGENRPTVPNAYQYLSFSDGGGGDMGFGPIHM